VDVSGCRTVHEAREAAARAGAEEVVRAHLERLGAHAAALNCFLQTFEEQAIGAARERGGRSGGSSLRGVPVAVKDNICLDYGRTTCGSRILERYESPFTATAAQRLIDAGAIILGKTNLDEFGMGSSGENSAFGPTLNPWDTSRVAGGSSSGSAAAVAAGIVPAALGSDTGGSVRLPAAYCGVVGLKPSYGRVSRYGLVAYASSLDQIGVLASDVRGAAEVLSVIAGPDPMDATCSVAPAEDFAARLEEPVGGLKVGLVRQAQSERNHPAVARALREAAEALRAQGASIGEIELPHLEYGVAAYYIIAPAEASSNLARFDGVRYGRRAASDSKGTGGTLEELYARSRAEGFGAEVQRRIMLGTYVLSAGYQERYYMHALKVRRKIKEDFDRAFAGVDVILMPATTGPAFKVGAKRDDPLAMYLEDIYTVTANLAGLPAIVVPWGAAEEEGKKLPIGVQLLAARMDEGRLLRAARMVERAGLFPGTRPGW